MKSQRIIFFILVISLAINLASAVSDLIAIQGNVQQDDADLSSGDLQVVIYDALSGGNIVYNSTSDFAGSISAGKYDVMLGNGSNELNLQFGKIYYMEIYINGGSGYEKFTFNGQSRQIFQSSVGQINSTSIMNSVINQTHLVSGINLTNAVGYPSENLTGNITLSQISSNEKIVLLNNSVTWEAGQNISTSTGGWFKGLFNWVVDPLSSIYLTFNGTTLTFNETKLNNTIDARASAFNETTYSDSIYTTIQNNFSNYYIKSEIDNNLSNYLLISDSRFNDTVLILNVNSSLWSYITTNEPSWAEAYNVSYESTYNATYAVFSYNQTTIANSYTDSIYNTIQNNFSNYATSSTLNGTYLRLVNSGDVSINASGDIDFNGGWQNGGLTVSNGDLYAQTIYVVNITSLQVNHINTNGSLIPSINNQFDLGSATNQWKNIFISGNANITDLYVGGVLADPWLYNQTTPAISYTDNQLLNYYTKSQTDSNLSLYLLLTDQRFNETALANSINTTANIQALGFSTGVYNATYESTYNITYHGLINNDSYLATYNSTYAIWSYNQTTSAITDINNRFWNKTQTYNISQIDSIITSNNASWTSTYNSTYASLNTSQWITSGSNIYYSAGNVGIKTNTITEALSVNGSINVTNTETSTDYALKVQSLTTDTYPKIAYFAGYDTDAGSPLTYDVSLGPNGQTYFRSYVTGASTDFLIQDADNNDARLTLNITGNGGAFSSLAVASSGKVGIGTSTPTHLLTVSANDNTLNPLARIINTAGAGGSADSALLFTSGTGGNYSIGRSNDDGNFYIAEGGNLNTNTRFAIKTSNGYVGIGTTNPSSLLHIYQDSNTYTNLTGYSINVEEGSTNANGPALTVGWSAGPVGVMDLIFANRNTDGLRVGTTAGYPVTFIQNNLARMYINTAGNVGIGTTSPAQKLDVRGNGNFSGTIFINNATDVQSFISPFRAGSGIIYNDTAGIKVGIGTASPTANLEINGSTLDGVAAPFALKVTGRKGLDASTVPDNGGNGGGINLTSGAGGDGDMGIGGNGGSIYITAGAGGTDVGGGDGGNGGDIYLVTGNPGSGSTSGNNGNIYIQNGGLGIGNISTLEGVSFFINTTAPNATSDTLAYRGIVTTKGEQMIADSLFGRAMTQQGGGTNDIFYGVEGAVADDFPVFRLNGYLGYYNSLNNIYAAVYANTSQGTFNPLANGGTNANYETLAGYFEGKVKIVGEELAVCDGACTPGVATLAGDLYVENQIEYDSPDSGIGDLLVWDSSTGEILTDASSLRYKKNISDYLIDNSKIMDLRPVNFVWNNNSATEGVQDFGLIAEEVNEVFPELVSIDEEGKPRTVRYDKLSVVLLSGYQEQEKKIQSQQEEISLLKEELCNKDNSYSWCE